MESPVCYKGSEPYVFVSYSHKDNEIVLPLIAGLQERGVRVWYDAGIEAGTEWPEYIANALYDSGCVICFITQNALESQNCKREINYAIANQKDMLAVYLEEVKRSRGMQMQLDTLQAIFRYRHKNDAVFLDTLAEAELLKDCRSEIAIVKEEPAEERSVSKTESVRKAGLIQVSPKKPILKEKIEGILKKLRAARTDILKLVFGRAEKDPQEMVVKALKLLQKHCFQVHNEDRYPEIYVNDLDRVQLLYEHNMKIKKAWRLLRKASDYGDPEAMFYSGLCCWIGLGTVINRRKAEEYIGKAYEQGYHQSRECLKGIIETIVNNSRYFGIKFGNKKVVMDYFEDLVWFSDNVPYMLYIIGESYRLANENYYPFMQDYETAVAWYMKAEKLGYQLDSPARWMRLDYITGELKKEPNAY